ncbi:hypothetical protein EC881467_0141, partial [Escherichia coli 88.1467]
MAGITPRRCSYS